MKPLLQLLLSPKLLQILLALGPLGASSPRATGKGTAGQASPEEPEAREILLWGLIWQDLTKKLTWPEVLSFRRIFTLFKCQMESGCLSKVTGTHKSRSSDIQSVSGLKKETSSVTSTAQVVAPQTCSTSVCAASRRQAYLVRSRRQVFLVKQFDFSVLRASYFQITKARLI